MNLTDIMTLSLSFEDTMKSGAPSVTKHASQKPSGHRFGGNRGNSSSGAVPMELGHIKPQDKSKEIYLRYIATIVAKWAITRGIVHR